MDSQCEKSTQVIISNKTNEQEAIRREKDRLYQCKKRKMVKEGNFQPKKSRNEPLSEKKAIRREKNRLYQCKKRKMISDKGRKFSAEKPQK